jgi:hypothetical protein
VRDRNEQCDETRNQTHRTRDGGWARKMVGKKELSGQSGSHYFRFLEKGEARLWLNRTHRVHRIAQNRLVNAPCGGDAARSAIGRFLQHVADVSTRPFPMNLVPARSAIEAFP